MNKKEFKEWRNVLVAQLLLQFSSISKKKSKKLRKVMEASMGEIIRFYKSLFPKKKWKQLELQPALLLTTRQDEDELAEYCSTDH